MCSCCSGPLSLETRVFVEQGNSRLSYNPREICQAGMCFCCRRPDSIYCPVGAQPVGDPHSLNGTYQLDESQQVPPQCHRAVWILVCFVAGNRAPAAVPAHFCLRLAAPSTNPRFGVGLVFSPQCGTCTRGTVWGASRVLLEYIIFCYKFRSYVVL